jgi:uncharacterized membrane protein
MTKERKVGLNGAIKMKQDEFKRQVKKEFAKLKVLELAGVAYVTLGTYYIGKFICNIFPKTFPTPTTGVIFGRWLIGVMFDFILVLLIMMMYLWIQKNWEWAEERVKNRGK